jgi:chemotaxis regulatin CheY-phosphate phosphatase CheZ
MEAKTPQFRIKVDALIRDGATGLPKFDDPSNTTRGVKMLLTLGDLTRMDRNIISDLGLDEVLEAINRI